MYFEKVIRNSVTDAVTGRRTVRSYTQTPLTAEQTDTLLEGAISAPSGRNSQPCIVRVLQNSQRLDELNTDFKNTVGWDTPAYTRWDINPVYQTAPCMIFIFAMNDCGVDAGIMVENIAITAKGIGLDSCIIASVGALFQGKYADKWKDILKVDRNARFMISVAVGNGNEIPEQKPRNTNNFMIIE